MTKRLLFSVSLLLSTAIAAPAFAQAVVEEPDAYALCLPNVQAGIGPELAQRREASIVNHGAADATPSRPWSAPAGHHQPTATDVVEADAQLTLDQEDANVDRIVRGICRGC
jgi:hypothetical protein